MKKFLAAISAAGFLISGCGETPQKNSLTIQVNGKIFSATLENNPTARAFVELTRT
ncbi:MAG: hypothetical protein IKN16_08390 [Selenomonadaceae bacterium]|nr:hypothetical protein [Selenomonadaceae bacterium]